MHSQKNDMVEKISNFLKHFLTSKLKSFLLCFLVSQSKNVQSRKTQSSPTNQSFCAPPASSEKAQKKEIPRLT